MAFEPMKMTHEGADVQAPRVLLLVFGFIAFAACLAGGLKLYYDLEVKPGSVAAKLEAFPGPRLQPNPTQDYADFHRTQRAQLAGTHWVDRGHGLVHVPIERAMAFVAAKGDGAYDPLGPAGDQKLPPTPQDGQSRDVPHLSVAPYGVHP